MNKPPLTIRVFGFWVSATILSSGLSVGAEVAKAKINVPDSTILNESGRDAN